MPLETKGCPRVHQVPPITGVRWQMFQNILNAFSSHRSGVRALLTFHSMKSCLPIAHFAMLSFSGPVSFPLVWRLLQLLAERGTVRTGTKLIGMQNASLRNPGGFHADSRSNSPKGCLDSLRGFWTWTRNVRTVDSLHPGLGQKDSFAL